MRREIKFRAWDRNKRIMVYEDKMVRAYFNPFRIVRIEDGFVLHNTMQYIGIKDESGKEIYEGDILNYCVGAGVGRVFYKDLEWRVAWHFNDGVIDRILDLLDRIIVVGNIYENPELIE